MLSRIFRLPLPVMLALVILSCNPERSDDNDGAGIHSKSAVVDPYGAVVRGDTSRREMALVLTGDTYADGGDHIRQTLRRHDVKASFFFTGNFYSNPAFEELILGLKNDGHYLGAHSDEHLLYADWTNRDSLLVTRNVFEKDILTNYEKMARWDIDADEARYFLPPYEWYNAEIVRWTRELGFQLINFSSGTRAAADYTFPEMGTRYVSSDSIFTSIIRREETDPHRLNGFILLLHIGTDPRRTDKFYYQLHSLLSELKSRNYHLVTVPELLQSPQAER